MCTAFFDASTGCAALGWPSRSSQAFIGVTSEDLADLFFERGL